jgi:hypothetical protein
MCPAARAGYFALVPWSEGYTRTAPFRSGRRAGWNGRRFGRTEDKTIPANQDSSGGSGVSFRGRAAALEIKTAFLNVGQFHQRLALRRS